MNSILNNMILKLYNRTLGSFADSKTSNRNLLLNKCFKSLDDMITAEEYHPEKANKTLEASVPAFINKKVSFDKLASYIAGNDDKSYILSKLKEFDKFTNDKVADLLLLNIDLLATDKINKENIARLDVAIDTLLDEVSANQGPFDSPISLKKYLDNVTNYLKQCEISDPQKHLEYTNILNSLLCKLTSEDIKNVDDRNWLSINDDFSVNKTPAFSTQDTENHKLEEIVQIIYNNIQNNDLFDNKNKNFFNDYQYILNLIKDNYNNLIELIDDEKDINNNLSENQKEFVSLVAITLLAREISSSNQIDKANLLSNNLNLFTKKAFEKVKEEIVTSSSDNMIDVMENLLRKSLKIANKINNEKFNENIHDYEDLLLAIQGPVKEVKTIIQEPVVKTKDYKLKPKSKNRYVSDVLEKLVKIIYEKDKVYSKELSNLRKIDLNKRLVNDKKELISEYAQKYLTEDEKEYLSLKYGTSFQSQNNISIDFSNKELLNRVINKTEQAIINEKAQFGNFLGLLKKDMISRISKDIITSSNKKMFIEKFNKLLKDNTSKDETSKALTSVMEELYDLSSSLVLPVVKDIEIPYTFINPNEIKKTIVEDSKQETPKYPNLFNIVKFSQKLDEESAKEVTLKQLQELKNEISKMQSPSTNILSKIESLIEKMDNPITSKQEREDIKKMLKNLSLEIKKSKEDFNGNRIEIVDQITKLPGVLNAIKFENPKNYLLNMIAKLNDKDLLQQFETDLTQLSISNKDYIKQKYNKQLQESLSKEEIEDFNRKFDTISIISQNEKNKKHLKNHISEEIDEYVMSNPTLDKEKQYLLYELNKKAKLLIDFGFKVKNRDDESIAKLKDTIKDMFKYDNNIIESLYKEIDKDLQDIELSKVNLQNVYLIQNIKNTLFKLNIDPEISKEIIGKLKEVTSNLDKEEITNYYKPVFKSEKDFEKFQDMVQELNIAEFVDADYERD